MQMEMNLPVTSNTEQSSSDVQCSSGLNSPSQPPNNTDEGYNFSIIELTSLTRNVAE